LAALNKITILCNKDDLEEPAMAVARRARRTAPGVRSTNQRRIAVLSTARETGLLEGASGRIAGRIRKQLIDAARARSGIESNTELLEYALACVALEDDFGRKLLARRGRVLRDTDLEF
jgi:hypothetical protein